MTPSEAKADLEAAGYTARERPVPEQPYVLASGRRDIGGGMHSFALHFGSWCRVSLWRGENEVARQGEGATPAAALRRLIESTEQGLREADAEVIEAVKVRDVWADRLASVRAALGVTPATPETTAS